MVLIDDNKIKEMTGKSNSITESLKSSNSTIEELNKLGNTASTFLDKLLQFKNMQKGQQEQTGQFNAKLNKGIEQQLAARKQPQIIIDKNLAMSELDNLINKLDEKKTGRELKQEFLENKKMLEPFVIEFIRRSTRLE